MAPLPQNNTSRIFVDYTDGIFNHTMAVRVAGEVDPTGADAPIAAFLNAVAPELASTWAVVGCRFQQAGTLFSLPAVMPLTLAVVGGASVGQYLNRWKAREHAWEGRSVATGRFVSVSLYGLAIPDVDDYRVNPSGAALFVQDSLDALDAANGVGVFIAIDEGNPVWKPYVNQNYNSYWEKESRG